MLITSYSKNSSSTETVKVAVTTWPVTYVYSMSDLLITYGVAFLCALVCSAIGLHAFYANGGSYQNVFSTYFRATNDADLHSQVEVGDMGADPLPRLLAQTRVTILGIDDFGRPDKEVAGPSSIRPERVSIAEGETSSKSDRRDSEKERDLVNSLKNDAAETSSLAQGVVSTSQEFSSPRHSSDVPTVEAQVSGVEGYSVDVTASEADRVGH